MNSNILTLARSPLNTNHDDALIPIPPTRSISTKDRQAYEMLLETLNELEEVEDSQSQQASSLVDETALGVSQYYLESEDDDYLPHENRERVNSKRRGLPIDQPAPKRVATARKAKIYTRYIEDVDENMEE